jgi:antitoxin VapB
MQSTHSHSHGSGAVRIPVDLRLPDAATEMEVRACGQERMIAPVERNRDRFFLDGQGVSDDFLAERADQEQAEREPF